MKKIFSFSICCFLLVPVACFSAEQEFYDITEEEVLENKYEGYKTTLDESDRGAFGGNMEIYRDVRLYDEKDNSYSWLDYGSSSGGGYFELNEFSSYGSRNFDLGSNDFSAMTEGFQSEFRSLFTRDDSLIRDFSVPQPRYFNQGFKPAFNQGQGAASGYRNQSSFNSGGNRSNNSRSSTNNAGYDAEQPALISWFFSVISYIREHPLMSGFLALLGLSLISLIQVIVQRYSRPFS